MAELSPDIANRVAVMRNMATNARSRGEHFVFVRIPEPLTPLERGNRYEDPLIAAFAATDLGAVTGGGQQLGKGKSIVYCGIDVVLTDWVAGMEFLRETLRRLGAPPATVIEEFLPEFRENPLGPTDS